MCDGHILKYTTIDGPNIKESVKSFHNMKGGKGFPQGDPQNNPKGNRALSTLWLLSMY